MSGKLTSVLIAAGVFSMLLVTGCRQSADLSLKFSPDRTSSYQSTTEVTKLFRFDQPNLDKLKEEQSMNLVKMNFTQTIQDIDAEGNATALITIQDLKVDITSKNESQLSFDSQNEADRNAPLAALLGQSYTIQISPTGHVTLLDAKDALATVTAPFDHKMANGIFDARAVSKRHQVAIMPEDAANALSVKDSWDKVVPSPPGLLAPKSYKKTYTLTAIDGDIAKIEMTAGISGEGPSDSGSSMGIFAKMFDNKDDYNGTAKINLTSGDVISFKETLISTYVAQEMPGGGDPEKGPDVLTMQFIDRVELQKLD